MKRLNYRFNFKGIVLLLSSNNNDKLCASVARPSESEKADELPTPGLNIDSDLKFLEDGFHFN